MYICTPKHTHMYTYVFIYLFIYLFIEIIHDAFRIIHSIASAKMRWAAKGTVEDGRMGQWNFCGFRVRGAEGQAPLSPNGWSGYHMVGSPHNRVTAAFRFSFQVQQAEPVMRGCLGILCILLCCEGGKVDPVSSVRGHGTKFKETLRSRVGRGAVRLGAF